MAVRIKVNKDALIKAIERARDEKVAEFSKVEKKPSTYVKDIATWRKAALARLAEATKQVRDGTFIGTSDSWRDVSYLTLPRKPRPEDYERPAATEHAKERITQPFNDAIKRISMSVEDTLSISEKDDYFQYI